MDYNDLFEYRNGDLYWKHFKERGFTRSGKKAGAENKGYVWVISKKIGGARSAHRIIWEMHNGNIPDGYVIDHADRNPLNNRIENLRIASRSENAMNSKGKSNKESGLPRNVYKDWEYNGIIKYRAQVLVNGEYIRVGNLSSIEEAEMHAKLLTQRLHGDYAFIKEE
jgi:hypothetical protein